IVAPSTETVHLSPEYLENMKNQFDSDYYRINVLGQDADYTAGLVCKGWGPLNIEETCYREDLRLYLSCDFNVDPMCWVVFHRFNGEYHFIDEFCLENTTSLEASEAFFKKYGLHESGLVLTGDASGKNRSTQAQSALDTNYTIIRNRLSQLGMRDIHLDLKTKNPPIETRVAAWNALVCNSQGVRRIKVNPQCKWLISNCENLRYLPGTSQIWEPTPRQIEIQSSLKFVKHIWDAASYPVEKYDPILREQPKTSNPSRIIPQSFHPRTQS
ncbi:MAG: hypothetical protein K2X66_13290, partial [Cyanobacteria bacterium]|nr:hypothetical protein [Cyanobacteriota bacterium]